MISVIPPDERADALGAFQTSEFTDPNNPTSMFDFDANGAGFGVRGGILYSKWILPMVKTGTELRLSYAPAEDTDGDATFTSGFYGGVFQRFQIDLPGEITPIHQLGQLTKIFTAYERAQGMTKATGGIHASRTRKCQWVRYTSHG